MPGFGSRWWGGSVAVVLALLGAAQAQGGVTRSRIFQPPEQPLTLEGLPAGSEMVRVTTGDGLALQGIVLRPAEGKPTLLVFHGNASSATAMMSWLAPLAQAGYGIVAAEYRGYSANPGSPSETGLIVDARAFHALAKEIAGSGKLIVIGHSLGGGVAFDLAKEARLDALVTVGTFVSIPAISPKIARAFITDRFDNLAAVPTLDEPYFIVHGLADETIPAGNGSALHAAASKAGLRGLSFPIAGAGHKPDGALMLRVIDRVVAFLAGDAPTTIVTDAPITIVPFGATSTVQDAATRP